MLHELKNIKKAMVHTKDEKNIGEVQDIYFDEHHWTVRYFVVNCGGVFSENLKLLSPYAITSIDWEGMTIETNLTKKQIDESPPADSKRPVSRLLEEKYSQHYGWPLYWAAGAGVWPNNLYPPEFVYQGYAESPPESTDKNELDEKIQHSNLRSLKEVLGYKIHAQKDHFGIVDDFLMEDGSYTIRFLVINTSSFLPSKEVLISPDWIESINWSEREFESRVSKSSITSAPAYTGVKNISRNYEEKLFHNHGEKGYWERKSEKFGDVEGWIPGVEEEKNRNRSASS